MFNRFVCWWKGHDIEKQFYRAPIYQYFHAIKDLENKHTGKYSRTNEGIIEDEDECEFWCHRCYKFIGKNK